MLQRNKVAQTGWTALGLVLCLLLLSASMPPAHAASSQAPAPANKGAVTSRNVVAQPATSLPPTAVYGSGTAMPMDGITVREKKTVDQAFEDELDDYNSDVQVQSIPDPLEKWNRFWFGFNDIAYLYVAKPAYDAWAFITPECFRQGLSNFWHNLLFPVRFANNLLQLRFLEAGVEFGRFIINSTAGLGGFFDVAKREKTIVPVHREGEDFGQTLGYWGVPHGCYLVWPLIGPSSVRETVGRVGDYFASPGFIVGLAFSQPWYVTSGAQAGFFFNDLNAVLPTYMSLKKAAVDPYIMMREAYVRHRAVQVAR